MNGKLLPSPWFSVTWVADGFRLSILICRVTLNFDFIMVSRVLMHYRFWRLWITEDHLGTSSSPKMSKAAGEIPKVSSCCSSAKWVAWTKYLNELTLLDWWSSVFEKGQDMGDMGMTFADSVFLANDSVLLMPIAVSERQTKAWSSNFIRLFS